MSRVCILTDSSAQFSNPSFQGHELVNILPMHIQLNGQGYVDSQDVKLSQMPMTLRNGYHPLIQPPSLEEFQQFYDNLSQYFSDILLILHSSHLNHSILQLHEIAAHMVGPSAIHIIDSQTSSVGLGLLVQRAAEEAVHGVPALEIKRQILGLIPHVYAIFCVQGLTYLYHAGLVDASQALVGEMLGVIPCFLLENGRLVPIQKARNSRQLVDIFHEFVSEFGYLKHLALIQGIPPFANEARNLHERILQDFPRIAYSEHTMGLSLATILGPRSLGIIAMDR